MLVRFLALGLLVSAAGFAPAASRLARGPRAAAPRRFMTESEADVELKQRLRAEAESPFVLLRRFVFGFSAASATVGSLFAVSDALGGRDGNEGLQNLAINAAVVAVSGTILRQDTRAENSRLERIKRGAELAALRLRVSAGGEIEAGFDASGDATPATSAIVPMSRLRKRKQVLVVTAGEPVLRAMLEQLATTPIGEDLDMWDVVVVPVPLARGAPWSSGFDAEAAGAQLPRSLAPPAAVEPWQDFLAAEIAQAQKQGIDVEAKGFHLVVRTNGRIGGRVSGMPGWGGIIASLASSMPNKLDRAIESAGF